MARLADPKLVFDQGCPDCGERRIALPPPLPAIDDDFDWRVRDYDSFRLFMMQELAVRYPSRKRWTAADMEVVIVELLAASLDRASHALDAIQAERYLATARRPQSVRRLLKLIGFDAVAETDPAELDAFDALEPGETPAQRLERYWHRHPVAMEAARRDGPRRIGEVHRMVTLADHERLTEDHPLVALARARLVWSGAWNSVLIAVALDNSLDLDKSLHAGAAGPPGTQPSEVNPGLWRAVLDYHRRTHIDLPPTTPALTARHILRPMIEHRRMAGSEVFLETARAIPIVFTLSVRGLPGYFRSELQRSLTAAFSTETGGFFEVGRHGFGEDLYASDIIKTAMAIEGVEVACLNRFKRAGDGFPDRTAAGVIAIARDEVVQCLNRRGAPEFGRFRITVQGGEVG